MSPSALHGVIPLPRIIEPVDGNGFTISLQTGIAVSGGGESALRVARYLADVIGLAAAPHPPAVTVVDGPVADGMILLQMGNGSSGSDEGYELTVSRERVTIQAGTPAGLFYGVQTLRQLLPPFIEHGAVRPDKTRAVTAAAARIADHPRFAWRGAMLDVSRHFLPVEAVKRYIDLMALYKLNRLHLHLSDDQGWRVEIASWPNLTAHGGSTEVGGGAGGFYTKEQYADLVRYAADRFITIVPEIDMPGHTNAALASYADLNCDGTARSLYTGIEVGFSALCVDKEITYRFVDDVVREISAMTPGPWLHIGGDEVKTLAHDRYVAFIERVQTIVAAHGKQMIGWDEIAPVRLLPSTVVQYWRPKTKVPANGARAIVSLADKTYLDMKYDTSTAIGLSWAGYIDVRTAYTWDPARDLAGVAEPSILGVEAPLWTETVATIRDVEFLAFPRLIAIAEVGWSRAEARDWETFRQRLGTHGPRLTALGVNFYRAPEVRWVQ